MMEEEYKEYKTVEYVDPVKACSLVGAFRTISGIRGCIPIIHGPAGCTWLPECVTNVNNPDTIEKIESTTLWEPDVIYGGEKKLHDALLKCVYVHHPDLMIVVQSCVSQIIGDDVEAVIDDVRKEIGPGGPKITWVDTGGVKGDETDGYNEVLEKIVEEVMPEPKIKGDKTVNLIGAVSGVPNVHADLEEIKRLLGLIGIKVNCTYGADCNVEDILNMPEASLNVLLSETHGIKGAEAMKKKFDVPYIVPYHPIGIENTKNFLKEVGEAMGVKDSTVNQVIEDELNRIMRRIRSIYHISGNYLPGLTFAVVCDSARAMGFTRFLAEDMGMIPLFVCFNTANEESVKRMNSLSSALNISPEVLVEPNHEKIRRALLRLQPLIIVGSMFDRVMLEQLSIRPISFIQANYPSFDVSNIFDHPFVGFNGVLWIVELIVNGMNKLTFPPQRQWPIESMVKG
jgi:Nitrogenase molybdenum-iron protein, alpha and beta chains